MPEGWGNVIADPRAVTHGVLWDVALADMRALDAYEHVERGLYRKVIQPVVRSDGGAARALVYVGKGEGGAPRAEYMDAVVAAARAWKLPEAHIRYLGSFSPQPVGANTTQEPAVTRKVRPRFATPFDR